MSHRSRAQSPHGTYWRNTFHELGRSELTHDRSGRDAGGQSNCTSFCFLSIKIRGYLLWMFHPGCTPSLQLQKKPVICREAEGSRGWSRSCGPKNCYDAVIELCYETASNQ